MLETHENRFSMQCAISDIVCHMQDVLSFMLLVL